MKKLDQSKVEYIAAEKRKGSKNATIAEAMGISVRYVQKLWARFKNTPKDRIVFPANMGRPSRGPPTREEQSAVLSARRLIRAGASRIWDHLRNMGMSIPEGIIHKILRESGDASEHKRKQRRRRWVRYERTHSNSMWHTDYKQLDDGRWPICHEDDASRFVTGWGAFNEAATEHAIWGAEPRHSRMRQAQIHTDRPRLPLLRHQVRKEGQGHIRVRETPGKPRHTAHTCQSLPPPDQRQDTARARQDTEKTAAVL